MKVNFLKVFETNIIELSYDKFDAIRIIANVNGIDIILNW